MMGFLNNLLPDTPSKALKTVFGIAVGLASITAIFSIAAVPPLLGAIAVANAVGFSIYGIVKLRQYLKAYPDKTVKSLVQQQIKKVKEKVQNIFQKDSVNLPTQTELPINKKQQTPPPIPPKPFIHRSKRNNDHVM